MTKKPPHLVQYQGSKRNLASAILQYFPNHTNEVIEPFAGTGAISIAAAHQGLASKFLINDLNKPLASLLNLVVSKPNYVAQEYSKVWHGQKGRSIEHYYEIREKFNATHDPILFLYILARCVKGAVRYNSDGLFNQSPDKRRKGTKPATMEKNILNVSSLLKNRTNVHSQDYKEILANSKEGDLIYMDPPYQGVCGVRDSRYFSGILHGEFVEEIKKLNTRNINFIISYDGKCGEKSYGEILPDNLCLKKIDICAGRSTQATLLGKNDVTVESLYISKNLYKHNEH